MDCCGILGDNCDQDRLPWINDCGMAATELVQRSGGADVEVTSAGVFIAGKSIDCGVLVLFSAINSRRTRDERITEFVESCFTRLGGDPSVDCNDIDYNRQS